jgi:hypothetical protein
MIIWSNFSVHLSELCYYKYMAKAIEIGTGPIQAAVLPLRIDAVTRAEQEAKRLIDKVRFELKEAGWDVRKVADYPSSKLSRVAYSVALSKYKLYASLTAWDYTKQPGSRSLHTPCVVKMDQARVAKFIETSKEDAAYQYDAFVFKLVGKIGPVLDAALEGNHVWGWSILRVILAADGSRQNWKTQQIVNISKLGKLFNQWPTRRVKP